MVKTAFKNSIALKSYCGDAVLEGGVSTGHLVVEQRHQTNRTSRGGRDKLNGVVRVSLAFSIWSVGNDPSAVPLDAVDGRLGHGNCREMHCSCWGS